MYDSSVSVSERIVASFFVIWFCNRIRTKIRSCNQVEATQQAENIVGEGKMERSEGRDGKDTI